MEVAAWLGVVCVLWCASAVSARRPPDEPLLAHESLLADEPHLAHEPLLTHKSIQTDEPHLVQEPLLSDEPQLTHEPLQSHEPFLTHKSIQTDKPHLVQEPLQADEPHLVHELHQFHEPHLALESIQADEPHQVNKPLLSDEPQLTDDEDLRTLYYDEEHFNISEKGMYLGSPCDKNCNSQLLHVFCDPISSSCQCDPKHPVALGVNKGCAKPKKLGEQCFYRQTCQAFDAHASCVQVNHNAYCQCDPGYHSTSHTRPTQRVFCTEDLVLLTADMPTLLGVASGIFVLAGLLCMVLHLYTRARYHPTHLADARLTPPCLYSLNDTAGTVSATRASSRASSRSGCTSGTLELESVGSRRAARRAGVAVSASRAGAARTAAILLISRHLKAVRREGGAHPPKCAAKGSRRPSVSSVQSSSSSIRSYSAKKWEREREQKERRQMSMRLAQLHDKMAAGREVPKHAPTPSPRSPNNSTDGLLPSVCEIRELMSSQDHQLQGMDGPCSSSSLY